MSTNAARGARALIIADEALQRAARQGSPGGPQAVVFDGGSATKNVRADRPANQSPIDDTKDGIVNLSSDTSGSSPGAQGAYSTISGGDGNVSETAALYGSIVGGLNNTVSARGGTVLGGSTNQAAGIDSVAGGTGCIPAGQNSFALGVSCITGAAARASVAFGFEADGHRPGQVSSTASGPILSGTQGSSQRGQLTYAAVGDNVGSILEAHGSVAPNRFTLEPQKTYSIHARFVAGPADVANGTRAVWIYEIMAYCDAGGAVTIDDITIVYSKLVGSPTWTPNILVSSSTINFTLDPTGDATILHLVVDLDWAEMAGA